MIKISSEGRLINGVVQPVSSKSISNRLLIIRHLAKDHFPVYNLSEARDTVELEGALENPGKEIIAGEGGTTFRFLTALLALKKGEFLLSAKGSMQNRPLAPLVSLLREMGAMINYQDREGVPPLLIRGGNLRGGSYGIPANISSQFISALLLIAPKLSEPLTLTLEGEVYSEPYISMTLELMKAAGINHSREKNRVTVNPGDYHLPEYSIESDWTAASYFYQLMAFAKAGELKLMNYSAASLQGDCIVANLMKSFGLETHFEDNSIIITKKNPIRRSFSFDFTHHPDLAMSMAVTCAGLEVEGEFYGIDHLRVKESDRIFALENELAKINCQFIKNGDHWQLKPGKLPDRPVEIHTYNDHRIAMAFAPLGLIMDGIQIRDPQVVNKSYPQFWKDLEKLSLNVSELDKNSR